MTDEQMIYAWIDGEVKEYTQKEWDKLNEKGRKEKAQDENEDHDEAD